MPNFDDPKKNVSGYPDPTAYKAIFKNDFEKERFDKLLTSIFTICDLAGFHIEERIVLKDVFTGRIYR